MKRYDTYKDSGVQWIGEIPSHWEVLAVKHLCNAIYAGGTPSTNVEEYWNGDIDWLPSGVCHDNRVNSAPQQITQLGVDNSSTKFIPAGTALLAMTGATCGHTAFCEIDAYANQSVTAYINHKNKLDSLFLWYLLQGAHEYITTFQSGGAQGGINVEQCKNWILCFPPLDEQKAIAEWLDVKCGEIDKVIATQERRIELLQELRQSIITRAVTRGINPDAPLKPSGIDWIGDVPNHWEICAFKRNIIINNGRDYKEYLDEEIYPVMGSGGCFAYCSKYIYDGEAVLLGRKGTIDKPLYINGKFWAVDTMFYAIPNRNLNCKFAYYMALTFPFDYYSTSTALPSMTQTDLGNNPVAIPPLAEQQEIVDYIEHETGKVDAAIARAEREISLLQELRQSVITEVVTGKRKVI